MTRGTTVASQLSVQSDAGSLAPFGASRVTRMVLFVAAFLAMAWYGLANSHLTFRGDSYEIWEVAKNFYKPDRAHSFVEYRGPFTFFFYNILYVISEWLGIHDVTFFRMWSAFLFACMAGLLFPSLFGRIFGRPVGGLKIFVFIALVFWFFCGYFLYPQTDIPALFFLLLAMLVALSAAERPRWVIPGAIVVGALLAVSVMMRFSYVLAALLLWIFWSRELHARHLEWWRIAVSVVLSVAVYFALTSMNSAATSSTLGLAESQLKGGITLQKVEWNAGDSSYVGMLTLTDRRGEAILKAEGITPSTGRMSLPAYFSLFLKYPADMTVMQARHLFGGLDLTYDAVYVQNLHAPRLLRSLVNYISIFLTLVIVRARIGTEGLGWRNLPLLLTVGAQSYAAIPFMGEVRFFMPLILTALAVAVFNFEYGIAEIRRNKLGMHALLFVAFCFMYSASQFETAQRVLLLSSP